MACACRKRHVVDVETGARLLRLDSREAARGEASESEAAITPATQCISCAQKHYDQAWAAFNEAGYAEADRRFLRGELRAVVLHVFREWPEIAQTAREAALLVQEGRDNEAVPMMDKLGNMIDREFFRANPEVRDRLSLMAKITGRRGPAPAEGSLSDGSLSDGSEIHPVSADSSPVDVVICLGNGSHSDNDELRILLRSIERNARGIGRVVIAGHAPEWVQNVETLDMDDPHRHNKDANLWEKTLEAIRRFSMKRFLWCADDNAFTQTVDVRDMPVIYNARGIGIFSSGSTWHNRMRHTLEWCAGLNPGFPADRMNFDCHAPQVFDGRAVLNFADIAKWDRQPGLCIYTAWRALEAEAYPGWKPWENAVEMTTVKSTWEKPTMRPTPDDLRGRMFCGYNDIGFLEFSVREALFGLFPEKSRYEK